MKTLLAAVAVTTALLTTAAAAQGRSACPSLEFAELQSLSAPEIHELYCEYSWSLDRAIDSVGLNSGLAKFDRRGSSDLMAAEGRNKDNVSACIDERLRLSRIMAKTGVSTSCGS
jgi:hypothetical protein